MSHSLLDRQLLATLHTEAADIRKHVRCTRAVIEQSRVLLRTFESGEQGLGHCHDGAISGRPVPRVQFFQKSVTGENSVLGVEPSVRRWIKADKPSVDNPDTEWKPIAAAPFDRELELAVIDYYGTHALVFPCRRLLRSWTKAETKEPLDGLRPTHWRDWQGSS